MKAGCLAVLAASVLAVSCVLAAPPEARAQAAERAECVVADALRRAGEIAEARKAYIAALTATPSSECASEALSFLNAPAPAPTCAAADALREAGETEEARKAYVAVLAASRPAGVPAPDSVH